MLFLAGAAGTCEWLLPPPRNYFPPGELVRSGGKESATYCLTHHASLGRTAEELSNVVYYGTLASELLDSCHLSIAVVAVAVAIIYCRYRDLYG